MGSTGGIPTPRSNLCLDDRFFLEVLSVKRIAAAVLGLMAISALGGSTAAGGRGSPVSSITLQAPDRPADDDNASFSSENVEWVTVMPQHTGTAGGKLVGKHYYLTDPRGVYIYDVADPAAPELVGQLPAFQIGPGAALAQEEPDTNGKILLVNAYNPAGPAGPAGYEALLVVDVTDKAAPTIVGSTDVADHTWTCILDCTYAIGRTGHIVDLREPTKPERVGDWREHAPQAAYMHDFEEVSPGRVVGAGQPSLYMDFRTPLEPKVLATLPSEFATLGYHGSDWPNKGKDRLLLMGAEVASGGTGGDCTDENIHAVATYDTTEVLKADRRGRYRGETFKKLSEWRVAGRGVYADGNAPGHTLYCGHWFDAHPKWRSGGILALAHYDWGTRFLDVDAKGAMEEIGWFQPVRGLTASAKWITNEIVYVHDYTRGLEILRFTGK